MSDPALVRSPGDLVRAAPTGWVARLARELLFARFRRLRQGELLWREAWGGEHRFGARSDADDPRARVTVHDPAVYSRILLGGSTGAGDAYVDGDWSADDLVALVRLFARQPGLDGGVDRLWARLFALGGRLAHLARPNSRRGSRRNIAAHYDLGNDFFALFLDPTMSYSCGLFERPEATMEEASIAKLDLVCRKLELRPGDELLEIGTGWGGLAIHAATRYGARVTTTTISPAQRALAAERIAAAGVADRIDLLALDYRDLPTLGRRFEKLVAIEMIEAVGERFLTRFLETIDRLLTPSGRALLQAITIPEQRFASYRRGADFIQRRVFPGSFLPSIADLVALAGRSTRLGLVDLEDLTPHYATTLRRWRERLLENAAAIRAAGYPERLARLWEFYFAYCEGGFAERVIGDVQLLFRPVGGARG